MKKPKPKDKETQAIVDDIMAANDPTKSYPRVEGNHIITLDPVSQMEVRQLNVANPKPITSLAEFQERCRKTVAVAFEFEDTVYSVEIRRTTPAEDAILDSIERSVMPPIIRGAKDTDDRADVTNAEYQKKKAVAHIEARSLGLYWCVPILSSGRPGLSKQSDIIEYIQGQFTSSVLETLYQYVTSGGVGLSALVNFT